MKNLDLASTFNAGVVEQKSFTGYLYSKDTVLARIENNIITNVYNYYLLPLHFRALSTDLIGISIVNWVSSRTLDYSRVNYRKMKQVLKTTARPFTLVLKYNAYSVTDSFWLKEDDSDMDYEELRSAMNPLSEAAITGAVSFIDSDIKVTPEFCNTGSFEKGWKRSLDGRWNLVKTGDGNMRTGCNVSEVIACKIAKLLNIKTAEYYMAEDGDVVITNDFTDSGNLNLEQWGTLYISTVLNDTTDNYFVLEKMRILGFDKEYLDMIFFDALIGNFDRHEFNFGLLTDSNTGKIIAMSPLYDHNLALVGHRWSDEIGSDELFLTTKAGEFLREQQYKFKELNTKELKQIIKKEITNLDDLNRLDIRRKFAKFDPNVTLDKYIYNYIMARYNILKDLLG